MRASLRSGVNRALAHFETVERARASLWKRVQGLVNRLYVPSLRGSGDIGSWYVHRHRLAMPQ